MLSKLDIAPQRKSTMKHIGTSGGPAVFTKDDFLTKRFLAAKYKVKTDIVEKAMKNMQLNKVKFVVNGHAAPVVIQYKSKAPRVHPMALDVFEEYLNKEKARQ